MKRALKVFVTTLAVFGVTSMGAAQASQGGNAGTHHHGISTVVPMMDTGWG